MVGEQAEQTLCDRLGDVSNVFLLAPTFSPGVDQQCRSLLACGDAVVYVVATTDLRSYVDRWRDGDGPDQVGILSLGGQTRSTAANAMPDQVGSIDVRLRQVESPGNLTKIGVELNDLLAELTEHGARITLCFESLTPMIQYSDVEKIYKFLHVFTNQIDAFNARAHYHLDPNAHDGSDVNLLLTTFDAVVEVEADGDVSVRTR